MFLKACQWRNYVLGCRYITENLSSSGTLEYYFCQISKAVWMLFNLVLQLYFPFCFQKWDYVSFTENTFSHFPLIHLDHFWALMMNSIHYRFNFISEWGSHVSGLWEVGIVTCNGLCLASSRMEMKLAFHQKCKRAALCLLMLQRLSTSPMEWRVSKHS